MRSDRNLAGRCVFSGSWVFPFHLVISYGEYLSSDYSIKIWDRSHALGLNGADETSVITDQVNVVEMQSFCLLWLFFIYFSSRLLFWRMARLTVNLQ